MTILIIPMHFMLISLLLSIPSVYPTQQRIPNDQDHFFNFDNFEDSFRKLDEEEKIHSTIDTGYERWESRCVRNGGQKALDNWLKAQEDLIFCAMNNFDWQQIQNEISIKKATGDLDLVFKKYCGKPIEDTRPCVENFLEVSRNCLQTKDKDGINVTMNMFDAAIDFMCQNNGDRLALFMAEDGMNCVEKHRANIMDCLNATIPEIFNGHEPKTNWIFFDHHHCRKGDIIRHCVESELLQCSDPTPSNIVNSMMLAMRNATPCRNMAPASFTAARAAGTLTISLIVVNSLLLFQVYAISMQLT